MLAIVTDEILVGIAIGLVFDEVGRRLVITRVRDILGADKCADSEDDNADESDSTSAHAKTVDYFDPTKAGGADDEGAS